MPEPTIQFCFENQEAASNAFETLDELGYRPERIGDGRTVKVYVNRADLTSSRNCSGVRRRTVWTGRPIGRDVG